MFVSGFTIIRNAVKLDYTIVQAINSILPVCDEMVVALGNSDDATRELLESIGSDKIRIIDTVWDDTMREGGKVLAVETNKALDAVSDKADWCFYIQADECVHEQYLPAIKAAMEQYKDDKRVEGLLFNYRHFYGSYDYVGDYKRWYRREIRIVRNDKRIRSYKDAQGFRIDDRKLNVKLIDAYIYHYGWVRHPKFMQEKDRTLSQYWHSDEWLDKHKNKDEFDYSGVDSLAKFTGTHPKVMQERIDEINWTFEHDISIKNLKFKYRVLYWIEKKFGWRIGEYKNYKII